MANTDDSITSHPHHPLKITANDLSASDTKGLDWDGLRKQSLLPGGFGDERVSIWPQLLGVNPCPDSKMRLSIPTIQVTAPSPSTPFPPSLLSRSRSSSPPPSPPPTPHRDEHQIHLDTQRSFVFYPVGSMEERYVLQARLHDLLVAAFRKRRKLCYFQGYHDIITVLFLTLPPALHLPCTEKLSLHRLRDSMGVGLEPVLGLVRVLKNLLHLADQEYAFLLERNSPLPYYALSNLLTLFAHDMPTVTLIQHVFDWLFCRPPIAAVYLAAAIIISRKAEVRRLEEQGEEGMMHSLLSGLPDLCDGEDEVVNTKEGDAGDIKVELDGEMVHVKAEADEEMVEAEAPQHLEKVPLDEWHGLTPNGLVDGSVPSLALETASESETELSLEHGESELSTFSSMQENGFNLVSSPPSSFDGLQDQDSVLKATSETTTPDAHTHTPMSTLSPSPPTSPPHSPSPTPSISISSDSVSSSNFLPRRIKIPLSTLLSQADALYASYPPTHPSLALSEIMGPQSVVFTWSESDYLGRDGDDREMDEDDEAETMVLHPELVVYPYLERSSPLSSSDEGDEKSERRRHRRKKLQKPKSRLFETRTMVVSAVVVLGVSMAVYGIRHTHHTHGHGGLGLRGSWKKIRGVLFGASERIVDGFGLW